MANFTEYPNKSIPLWFLGLILVLGLGYAWHYTTAYDLRIALDGFSPVAWTYDYINPELFTRNFPSGIEKFDCSFMMHIYPLFLKWFHITPDTLMPSVITLEVLVMSIISIATVRVLLPNASLPVYLIAVVLMVASSARNMSLSRFFQPFFIAQYYYFAEAPRIAAILFTLNKRYLWGAAALALSALIHPIYAVTGLVFIIAMFWTDYKHIPFKEIAKAGLLFLVITIPWVLMMYHPFDGQAIEKMPFELWKKYTMLNSVHWYPLAKGILTVNHTERFIQYLGFILLLVYLFTHHIQTQLKDRRVIAGMMSVLMMVVLGFAFSAWGNSQTLIKLSLHRSDDLFFSFAIPYIAFGLWQIIKEGNGWEKVFGLAILTSPLYMDPGFPILITLLFMAPFCFNVLRGRMRARKDYVVFGLVLAIIGLIGFYWSAGYVGNWDHRAYTGMIFLKAHWLLNLTTYWEKFSGIFLHPLTASFSEVFWFIVWGGGVLALLNLFIHKKWGKRYPLIPALSILLVLFGSFNAVNRINHKLIKPAQYEEAQNYREAQRWAKEHTPADTLFMVDPNIYYGWRDYSLRNSFGNLREWLYTGWLYDSNYAVFKEGLKRFREFGIDPEPYTQAIPGSKGFRDLASAVEESYYGFSDTRRQELADKYNIDYFVLKQGKLNVKSKMFVSYENKYFMILKPKNTHEITQSKG